MHVERYNLEKIYRKIIDNFFPWDFFFMFFAPFSGWFFCILRLDQSHGGLVLSYWGIGTRNNGK